MSNPKHSSRTASEIQREISDLTYGNGKGYPNRGSKRMLQLEELRHELRRAREAAAPQPRKAPPRIIGKTPCKQCGVMNWQDATECSHCATPRGEPAKHQEWRGIEKDDPAQPAKAAQDNSTDAALRIGNEILAELEERRHYAKIDKATIEQQAAELERVKQQLAIAESCLKNNDAAFETVKQQRDGLLAACRLGAQLQREGDIWSVNPGKMRAFLDAAQAAIANAEKEAK